MFKDAVKKLVFEKFTEQLKDPDSAISQEFNKTLYGDKATGKRGILERMSQGEGLEDTPKDTMLSSEQLNEAMKKYKRTAGQTAFDLAVPAVGTAAKAGTTAYNAYQSLLGDALLAVSQGLQSQGFDNPMALVPAAALATKAKGAVAATLGDAANTIAQGIAQDVKYNREKDKATELLISQNPSGQFFDARKQMTKNQNW
jgi:hypothetical protein